MDCHGDGVLVETLGMGDAQPGAGPTEAPQSRHWRRHGSFAAASVPHKSDACVCLDCVGPLVHVPFRFLLAISNFFHRSLAGPSIVDMCTGCGVFHALASLHIIPDHICSDCQIIFLVEHQKKKKEESNTDSMSIDACFESSRVDMSALSKSAASAAVADDTGE